MSNHMNLRGILDANKLIGPNFLDWHRNLRIVLKHEKIGYVIEQLFPEVPTENSIQKEVTAYNKHSDDDNTAACVMLAAMSPELQKQHEEWEERISKFVIVVERMDTSLMNTEVSVDTRFARVDSRCALRWKERETDNKGKLFKCCSQKMRFLGMGWKRKIKW
ncbi:uncharacterized protein LOC111388748 [Olea europaea var. sylvestris]|uniref:uncharacterized protein LOC111388748 n=1 Tax=Olea europaea var. sylvestris TaxID=158386 RepID=UPI000C1D0221|nr:uncharacterized protein LOC111388748 [Olea europaea var. sylvestris]